MKPLPTRLFRWGIGLLALGVLAYLVATAIAGLNLVNTTPSAQSAYIWVVSPLIGILQSGTFPLGAALIAASIVIRHIDQRDAPQNTHPQTYTTYSTYYNS